MAPRVCIVRSSPHLGGVERFLVHLGDALSRRGWKVALVFLYRGVGEHPAARAARARGLPVFTLPERGVWDLRALLRLRRLLAHLAPDVVHTHDYKSDVLVALARPRRHMATAHGFTDGDAAERLYRRLDLGVLRRLPRVIAPSSFQKRVLVQHGMSPSRVWVIPPTPDWADLDRRAGQPLPAPARADRAAGPVLTFAGRLSFEKGGDVLLAALPRVLTAFPAARVWVLGDGPRRRGWRALAQRLGVAARVRWWGWREDAPAFLRHSSVVVVPSRREAFGLTALEAGALGVPVVSARVGGLPESLAAAPAIFVPPDDAAALAEALMAVLGSLGDRQREAQRAAARVRARFPFAAVVDAHVRALDAMCEGVPPCA